MLWETQWKSKVKVRGRCDSQSTCEAHRLPLPMGRAEEQNASVFGHDGSKRMKLAPSSTISSAPQTIPDTPNERLVTVLRAPLQSSSKPTIDHSVSLLNVALRLCCRRGT